MLESSLINANNADHALTVTPVLHYYNNVPWEVSASIALQQHANCHLLCTCGYTGSNVSTCEARAASCASALGVPMQGRLHIGLQPL